MAKEYSPYKMKGHTLPGIQQSPAKQFEEGDYYDTRSKKSPNKQFEEGDYYDTRSAKKKSPGKWVQFIPMALSAASSLSKMGKNKEE